MIIQQQAGFVNPGLENFSPPAAQGGFISPEHLKSPEGGAGFWPAEPKQKDTLFSVSFCLNLDSNLDILNGEVPVPFTD